MGEGKTINYRLEVTQGHNFGTNRQIVHNFI